MFKYLLAELSEKLHIDLLLYWVFEKNVGVHGLNLNLRSFKQGSKYLLWL